MIHHRPIMSIHAVEQFYSDKDGVPVKYVCTTAVQSEGVIASDVFFRETPHPTFGNRYFHLYRSPMVDHLMIGNADPVEELEFTMVEGTKGWEYSQHRHDFFHVDGSGVAIDGGRAYFRRLGPRVPTKTFVVRDGEMVPL